MKVGAYWYSYAASVEDAKAEAQTCINAIKGATFEYPIYFDLEERSQFAKGRAFCNSLVKTFCNALGTCRLPGRTVYQPFAFTAVHICLRR
ncbi:MAG: hypothetical protein ACLTD2_05120 [Ruminococcus sp.]